jgi:hypothetical protein
MIPRELVLCEIIPYLGLKKTFEISKHNMNCYKCSFGYQPSGVSSKRLYEIYHINNMFYIYFARLWSGVYKIKCKLYCCFELNYNVLFRIYCNWEGFHGEDPSVIYYLCPVYGGQYNNTINIEYINKIKKYLGAPTHKIYNLK